MLMIVFEVALVLMRKPLSFSQNYRSGQPIKFLQKNIYKKTFIYLHFTIVKYEQALMPRITTKISAILGRHLLIFLGIYEFLAFLTALEIFLLNEKYFSTYFKKTYFYKKKYLAEILPDQNGCQ